MIDKFDSFQKGRSKNEKKNTNSSDNKNRDDKFISDDYLDYDDEVNRQILAKEKPNKSSAKQTNIDSTKKQIPMVDPNLQPNDNSIDNEKNHKTSKGIVNLNDEEKSGKNKKGKKRKVTENKKSGNVGMYGKVAKFPKNTKASSAISFLENVKLSKNRIWYIMVEKQDNELQMVKYDMKKGVNITKFVNELKTHYMSKYKGEDAILEQLDGIKLMGDQEGNYSAIKNIPSIEIDGKKVITRITEDLITLLSGKVK